MTFYKDVDNLMKNDEKSSHLAARFSLEDSFYLHLAYCPCAVFSSLPSSHHFRTVLSMDFGFSPREPAICEYVFRSNSSGSLFQKSCFCLVRSVPFDGCDVAVIVGRVINTLMLCCKMTEVILFAV